MYTTAFLRQFGEAHTSVSKLTDTIEEVFGGVSEVIFRDGEVVVTDGNGVLQSFQLTPAFTELIEKATSPDKPKRGRPAKAAQAKVEEPAPEPTPERDFEHNSEPEPLDPEEPAVAVSESIRFYMSVEERHDGVWEIREYIEGAPEPVVHGSENQMAAALRRAGDIRKRYDGDMNRVQVKPVATVPYSDDDPPF
jgi:hypothetical protein